ncbi:MAG: HAD family hydrolase [Promethearchaeota archaeon]
MKVKAIIFDFGFTLFYFQNATLENYLDCFEKGLQKAVNLLKELKIIESEIKGEQFSKIFKKKRQYYFKLSFKTKQEYKSSFLFAESLKEINKLEYVDNKILQKLADLYHSCELEEWVPYKTTEATLEKLKNEKQINLAVLSNHPHHSIIVELLKKYDFLKFFDAVVTSAEVGKRKPACEIFEYTLQKINLLDDKESCLMCGDEYGDIIGGYKAGLKIILCERNVKFPFEKEIDLPNLKKIKNISELLEMI